MNQENDEAAAHLEESPKISITVDDVYKLAGRKCIIFYVESDEESEEILALEIENVRNDPLIHYGPILDSIKELFPNGIYPPHIQSLYDEMVSAEAGRGPVFNDESILELGANLVAALDNIEETNEEEKS